MTAVIGASGAATYLGGKEEAHHESRLRLPVPLARDG